MRIFNPIQQCLNEKISGVLFQLVFLLVCGSVVSGRDIHVDNMRGRDTSTGWELAITANQSGPVRTIMRAIKLAKPGDRIILAKNDKPYHESIIIAGQNCSGIFGFPFELEGNGAILDGSVPVPQEDWHAAGRGLFRCRPAFGATQNLFNDGVPLERVELKVGEPWATRLAPMQWCLRDGYIYFRPEGNKLPWEYTLSYAGLNTGVALYHVHDIKIKDLIIQGYQTDGIHAVDAAVNVMLENVTLRGNGRAGLVVSAACKVGLRECTLGNNMYAQLLTEALSKTELKNTELISNTAPGWVDNSGKSLYKNSGCVVLRDGNPISGGLDERGKFAADVTEPNSEKTVDTEIDKSELKGSEDSENADDISGVKTSEAEDTTDIFSENIKDEKTESNPEDILNTENEDNPFIEEEMSGAGSEPLIEEPEGEPAGELMGEPEGEPVEEPEGEPAEEPVEEPVEEPEGEPAGELMGEPEGEPAGELMGEPAGELMGEPEGEPEGELAEELMGEPAEEPAAEEDEELLF